MIYKHIRREHTYILKHMCTWTPKNTIVDIYIRTRTHIHTHHDFDVATITCVLVHQRMSMYQKYPDKAGPHTADLHMFSHPTFFWRGSRRRIRRKRASFQVSTARQFSAGENLCFEHKKKHNQSSVRASEANWPRRTEIYSQSPCPEATKNASENGPCFGACVLLMNTTLPTTKNLAWC